MSPIRKAAVILVAVLAVLPICLFLIRWSYPNSEELNFEHRLVPRLFPSLDPSPKCPGCNLVVVTIDTLRADNLGCYGYPRDVSPNIDGLAAKSMLLTRVYAPVPLTIPSHASLFTGRAPYQHKVQDQYGSLGQDEVTLAERLRAEGYTTGAITSVAILRPQSGLNQGFDTFDFPHPSIGNAIDLSMTRTANQTSDRALRWLTKHKQDKFFLWVHYWDPHTPYDPLPKHQIFLTPFDRLHQAAFVGDSIPADRARYDGEIRFVDSELRRILAFLEGSHLNDRTIVLLTSDHGENFGANDHGDSLYEHELHIPAILYNHDFSAVSSKLLMNSQLMPTLLDILGLDSDSPLRPSLFDDKELPILFFSSDNCVRGTQRGAECSPRMSAKGRLVGARVGDLKYIFTPNQAGGLHELYDLQADPGERDNLIGRKRTRLIERELRQAVARIKPLIHTRSPSDMAHDKELERSLRSLGYVQ